jgi:chaperone modulatory protein CbpM
MEPNPNDPRALEGLLVDDDTLLPLADLARACGASVVQVEVWVAHGVVEPVGANRDEWRFTGSALSRMRAAMRLERDLEVNPPGVALALELMDELAALRARLARLDRR